MRFRFNVLLNGFVVVSVAVRSATAQALAHADILNGQGTKIGDADITSNDQGFQIAVKGSNLSAGEQDIHTHTVGNCEHPAFTSATGRFNPTSAYHGAHHTGDPHPRLGDLRNLVVGNNGSGVLNLVANEVALGDGVNSLFHEGGSSLMIHAKPDHLMSDLSGTSGDRIACGVIQE